MVVLLDLDDTDACNPHEDPFRLAGYPNPIGSKVTKPAAVAKADRTIEQRPNPNINGFSAALGCYPCAF